MRCVLVEFAMFRLPMLTALTPLSSLHPPSCNPAACIARGALFGCHTVNKPKIWDRISAPFRSLRSLSLCLHGMEGKQVTQTAAKPEAKRPSFATKFATDLAPQVGQLTLLPWRLLASVISYLSLSDHVCGIARVCRAAHDAARSPASWSRRLDFSACVSLPPVRWLRVWE